MSTVPNGTSVAENPRGKNGGNSAGNNGENGGGKGGQVRKQPPITNSTVQSEDRKRRLVKKHGGPNPLKYKAWIGGHIMSVVFGVISVTFQLLRLRNVYYINSICYRLSLAGAVIALGATVSHKFGFKYLPAFTMLIAQQNFQYMVLAVVWVFTFKSIFKLLPFVLISTLQLSSHKKIELFKKQERDLAAVIAYDELFLIVYLLVRTLFFRNTSGYQLTIFLLFYWLRILFNTETSNLFGALIDRFDGKISKVKNEKILHYWSRTKQFMTEKRSGATY